MTKHKSSEAEFFKTNLIFYPEFSKLGELLQGLIILISHLTVDISLQTISNILLLHFTIREFKFHQPRSK